MIKRTRVQEWSNGVLLLGRFEWFGTGCWLLTHNGEGAIVEFPPYSPEHQESPATKALNVCKKRKIKVKYLLCTHTHVDHFSLKTAREMQTAFPDAEVHLQRGFEEMARSLERTLERTYFFDNESHLNIGGESLHLIHAPKHSWTDTHVIFKGVAITGDWELNTLRSAHDDKPRYAVPTDAKLQAIEKMARFESDYNYRIHKVFSVHANDRRENIDFTWLMNDTKNDRAWF
jgi:hydroxyacylglutathione hydrolase